MIDALSSCLTVCIAIVNCVLWRTNGSSWAIKLFGWFGSALRMFAKLENNYEHFMCEIKVQFSQNSEPIADEILMFGIHVRRFHFNEWQNVVLELQAVFVNKRHDVILNVITKWWIAGNLWYARAKNCFQLVSMRWVSLLNSVQWLTRWVQLRTALDSSSTIKSTQIMIGFSSCNIWLRTTFSNAINGGYKVHLVPYKLLIVVWICSCTCFLSFWVR